MKASIITITKKQNHFISLLAEACEKRESLGLIKFDIFNMGGFYYNSLLLVTRDLNYFRMGSDVNFMLEVLCKKFKNNQLVVI